MLSLARYCFTFRITKALRLPDYAGSALRGAFGHALMQLSGISKEDILRKAPFFLQSPYAHIFEPQSAPAENILLKGMQNLPVPYVIEPPLVAAKTWQPGELLHFELVLSEPALAYLSTIILAWRRAFLRGIGKGDGTAELVKVELLPPVAEPCCIYNQYSPQISHHSTHLVMPVYSQPQSVYLHLQTPLQLQQKGVILGVRDINASIFLRHLIRRVTTLLQPYSSLYWPLEKIRAMNALADLVQDEHQLTWQEWERYSSRQKKVMKLNGLIGYWYLKDVAAELLPFIYLGQWLHVGKETSFGLGKYVWTESPEKTNTLTVKEHTYV